MCRVVTGICRNVGVRAVWIFVKEGSCRLSMFIGWVSLGVVVRVSGR